MKTANHSRAQTELRVQEPLGVLPALLPALHVRASSFLSPLSPSSVSSGSNALMNIEDRFSCEQPSASKQLQATQ